MQTMTPTFAEALRASHGLALKATAYPPGRDPIDLEISGGSVTIDRTADNRRSATITLSDPTLYPTKATDPVAPYGTEVMLYRGIRYASTSDLVLVGTFRLQDAERAQPITGGIPITLWDRSKGVQDARFPYPRKFAAQTTLELLELLISEVYPGINFLTSGTTADLSTTVVKHVVPQDRWGEVMRLILAHGCEAFFNAQGDFVIQDIPDPTTAPVVWTVDAGADGVMVNLDDKVTRDGAPNIVIASGESKDGTSDPVTSQFPHGYDTNLTSPTYYLGAYGRVPRYYSNPHIRTQAAANKVADAQLIDHLGASRTVSFGAVPNPALEAGDAIQITRPDGTGEVHIIDALEIPLSPGGVMTGETRTADWSAS